MRYHVLDTKGEVLMSNIDSSILEEVLAFPEHRSYLYNCSMHKTTCRAGKLVTKYGTVYLCMATEINSKRIFQDRLNAMAHSLEALISFKKQAAEDRDRQLTTLRHNLIELNSHAIQALYKLVPQEKLGRGTASQKEAILKIIEGNKQETAETILKLIKLEALVKTEFLVEKFINGSTPALEAKFLCHPIEKVFYIAYSIFTTDFDEKDIKVSFKNSDAKVLIDYETVITGVRQVFNNIVKYSCPSSRLGITFLEESDKIRVVFDMISLKINDEEKEKIFDFGYSGQLAVQSGKSGGGIGLFVAKKCFDFNDAVITFSPNVRKENETTKMDPIYQNNQICISFKKCE